MSESPRSSSPTNSDSEIEFSTSISKTKLVEYGHRVEAKVVEVSNENAELRNRITELEAAGGMRVAQKFVIAYNLFLAEGVRCDADHDKDYNLTAANRYADSEGVYEGQLRDLEEIIPSEYQEARKNLASFQSSFHSQQGEMRTTTYRRIRKSEATAHIFFMFDAKDLESSGWRKENCCELIGYRSDWGQGRAGYSALDAPIIHANHEAPNGYHPDTVFKGEVPQRCLEAVLFGPSSVRGTRNGGSPKPATNEYMARLIGAKFTTPGMMALGCTLACWGLSSDPSLAEVNTKDSDDEMSGVNWAEYYNDFKQEIEEGLEKKRPQILEAFRVWDERNFKATASQGLGVSAIGPSQSGPSIRDERKAHARARKAAASRAEESSGRTPRRRIQGGRRDKNGRASEGEGQGEGEGDDRTPQSRRGSKRAATGAPKGSSQPPQKQTREGIEEESDEHTS
ncbi:hypothetical protein PENSPDRAFT_694949 [Peniophora sp. CONT]|nr:hypothetical protein PENSPDRAFT_694949 [Peniophora sp. CONT]